MNRRIAIVVLAIVISAVGAAGEPVPVHYQPYEILIGDWSVGPTEGPPMAVSRFSWGTGRSYIWFTTSLMQDGKEEPHFEGMLLWNGVEKYLDMLLTIDVNGGSAQEQGTFRIQKDGSFVREITAISTGEGERPAGKNHFRQTFTPQGRNKMLTSIMRETKGGWVATFPGSDHMVMTRR